MSKRLLWISFPILLLVIVYFLGPKPEKPKWDLTLPAVPSASAELEQFVAARESRHKIKPDNEARIVWADSTRQKTAYSVVYLHGFYASQEEGDPVHENFAKAFGCNLYLARLADHGIDTVDQLVNFTVDRGWAAAKEALAIGKAIGEKVIVMSTSSGGTYALVLAAEYPDDVFALVNLSPNIRINHPLAFIGNDPWGLQVGRLVVGGKYYITPPDSVKGKYWYQKFRMEAVSELQELIEQKMNDETFSKVTCPSLTLYYFKDEQHQDKTVKVSAMLEMNEALGTPDSLKVTGAVPGAGEHVIGSYLTSKDLVTVEKLIRDFAVEKLKMNAAF